MMDPREIAVERLCAQIGYTIRMARLARGLKLSTVAKRAGISMKEARNLERGEHYDASLRTIALIFYELGFEPRVRLVDARPASGMEAPSGGETGTGSTEGDGPVGEAETPKGEGQ